MSRGMRKISGKGEKTNIYNIFRGGRERRRAFYSFRRAISSSKYFL